MAGTVGKIDLPSNQPVCSLLNGEVISKIKGSLLNGEVISKIKGS